MLSKVISFVPFWQTISWYSADARRKAIPKFLLLWVMSLSPLALSALLQEVPPNEGLFSAFVDKFWKSFLRGISLFTQCHS